MFSLLRLGRTDNKKKLLQDLWSRSLPFEARVSKNTDRAFIHGFASRSVYNPLASQSRKLLNCGHNISLFDIPYSNEVDDLARSLRQFTAQEYRKKKRAGERKAYQSRPSTRPSFDSEVNILDLDALILGATKKTMWDCFYRLPPTTPNHYSLPALDLDQLKPLTARKATSINMEALSSNKATVRTRQEDCPS